MKTLKLSLEYGSGPVWKTELDWETKREYTGIDIIDNDEIVKKLDTAVQDLYSSCWDLSAKDPDDFFDVDKEIAEAPKMLELMNKLNARLEEINDGSYEVDDLISWQLEELIERYHK